MYQTSSVQPSGLKLFSVPAVKLDMEDTTAHINHTFVEHISKLVISQELAWSYTTLAQKGKVYFLSDVFVLQSCYLHVVMLNVKMILNVT